MSSSSMSKNKPTKPKSFEIEVEVRDALGNPTGRRKTFESNDAFKLWKFWERNRIFIPKKKKKAGAASKSEAEKIIKKMEK